jgi:hypothetical protein
VDELSPPGQPRYEQLADRFRRRVFGGDWPGLASGPYFADQYRVSQTAVQKAFEILEREGLLRMEFGKRTTVPDLLRWLVEIRLLPGDDGTAVTGAAAAHAAVQGIDAEPGTVRLTVVSANWGGAASVAASVAGALAVESVTVRESPARPA